MTGNSPTSTTANTAASTIDVELGERSYEIRVGSGLLGQAGNHLAPLLGEHGLKDGIIIVTDTTVASHHLSTLEASLKAAGLGYRTVTLEPGEHTKSFSNLEKLIDELLSGGLERRTTLIAFGGGVIGDITGFAAAIALRGIDFIQIPTTLLAQVDSSVGGKTGINTTQGKNLVGAFYQPRMVLADIDVLDTLPRRQLLAGYAEVVKYGLIGDVGFFEWLEEHGAALIDGDKAARIEAIAQSCRAKAQIVSGDEHELGNRALLNLGHTFAHAMEAESGFSDALLHGEAVGIGMILAFELSEALNLCPAGAATRLKAHFDAVGLPITPKGRGFDTDTLLAHMHHDKKVVKGQITFILAHDIGKAVIAHDVDMAQVARVLEHSLKG
ncbi:MAG: 3-dehydroquinate synthase [Rhodospirillales bacterium]|mgnify:CR=1 FL=1|jgi:3-dehydroquinate synthase|nr:3-dehydroquinate synthase [Rhodospirillales bacterium]MBT5076015.1 3-dehydroquinate synthase [Rhodospirillales bacterium]MBT5113863.1 3-dehydroquinate synthase [Rhodospirillales bacterium]MBT5672391.1 3-dehydroquinate synthase [Rhodospirillales bacterium]MBT6185940.1 3-dehydroquinate synthase [Rhodospirillales bacterium]